MELSLSLLPSFIKHAGKFYYPSSCKCSQTSLPPSNLFYPRSSCSKLAPHESHRSKAIPSVRAYTDQVEADKSDLPPNTISHSLNVFWKFMRPFVAYSSTVQFTSVMARTWIENSHLPQWSNWSMPTKTLAFLVAVACSNAYTNGINQIFDVEIDKVNMPDLPIAAGELPLQSAWLLVLGYVAIGLLAARIPSSGPFDGFLCCQFLLGTIYSVPPFRTKRSTIGAFVTCALIQGFVNIFCLTAGARATLGLPFQLSWPAIYMSIFTTIFSLTMGFMKDISDVEGDRKNNVPTLATIIEVRKTAMIGFSLLFLNSVGSILAAILLPQASKMEKANYEKEKSLEVYMSPWLLFLVKFLIFPFI